MHLHKLHTSNYNTQKKKIYSNTKILLSNNLLQIQIHYDCLTLLYLIYIFLKYKNII